MTDENKGSGARNQTLADRLIEWRPVSGVKPMGGGQGTVVQVRNRADGRIGALKTLHSEHLNSRERRYRMRHEVLLLNLLDAKGVPRVLSDNTETWESVGTRLYTIVEWVDGPTLADFCDGKPQIIDTAVSVVAGLI